MPKKQVYSPVNIAADAESSSQHHFSQYRDDPSDHDHHDPEQAAPAMPSSGASIKSALSKKSRKSRRRVDNDELSVPLHALPEGGGGDGGDYGDEHDVDVESGGVSKGAAVSLEDDPFYVFREDLTRKLCLVDEGLKRFLNVIHDTVSFNINWRRLGQRANRSIVAARSSLLSRMYHDGSCFIAIVKLITVNSSSTTSRTPPSIHTR